MAVSDFISYSVYNHRNATFWVTREVLLGEGSGVDVCQFFRSDFSHYQRWKGRPTSIRALGLVLCQVYLFFSITVLSRLCLKLSTVGYNGCYQKGDRPLQHD